MPNHAHPPFARLPLASPLASTLATLATLATLGCGGTPAPAAPAATPAVASAAPLPSAPPAPETAPVESHPPPSAKHLAAEAAAHVDPAESDKPIELTPLVAKGASPAYPKPTMSDGDCVKGGLSYTGNHKADYQALVAKCGTPTGLIEYTKPGEGRLHSTHDKRDHFKFSVTKGHCYRYFAVADDGIQDIDILVFKNGALLATDKTHHPIAVIDHDKPWCVDEDMNLDFAIEVDGRGAGAYSFGVWTKPKSK